MCMVLLIFAMGFPYGKAFGRFGNGVRKGKLGQGGVGILPGLVWGLERARYGCGFSSWDRGLGWMDGWIGLVKVEVLRSLRRIYYLLE